MHQMKRYAGEALGPNPHIVVLGSCKVGNFVISTPVLRGLKSRFPDAVIGFIGSELTADFEEALHEINWRASWDKQDAHAGMNLIRRIDDFKSLHGDITLAVNLDGFNPVTCTILPWLHPHFVSGGSLKSNMRSSMPWGEDPQQRFLADKDWDSPDFLERYEGVFESNYIASLFCHLAYVRDFVNPNEIDLPWQKPKFNVPELLIHCTTARAAKIWAFEKWVNVVNYATKNGWRVGLIGSPPAAQRDAYNSGDGEEWLISQTDLIDLRGRTNLIQLAGACRAAKAVISVDAGPLHIAAAVSTPTLAVVGNDLTGVGASPIRLWLPRGKHVNRTISSETCQECCQHSFQNNNCLVENHPCMNGVSSEQVINWLSNLIPNH